MLLIMEEDVSTVKNMQHSMKCNIDVYENIDLLSPLTIGKRIKKEKLMFNKR